MPKITRRNNRSHLEDWLTEDRLLLLRSWAREGYTNKMIAERMNITHKTLWMWCTKSEQLREAINEGKEIADYKVENALFKAALGYETTEVKSYISMKPDKQGNRTVRVEKTVKQVAPNVTAIAMWLNNRKPDEWKRNRDNMLEFNDSDNNITVNIIKNSELIDGSEDKSIDKNSLKTNEEINTDKGKKGKLIPYMDNMDMLEAEQTEEQEIEQDEWDAIEAEEQESEEIDEWAEFEGEE